MTRLPSLLLLLSSLCACTQLPDPESPTQVHWLDQQWSPALWTQFYHLAQGTEIMPYAWFLALEQPEIPLTLVGEVGRFADSQYLARFGFLPDRVDARGNPDGLPVGFSRDARFQDPNTGTTRTVVGFTCAVCHTGQLNVRNEKGELLGIRIDGGAAMTDLQAFEGELAKAVIFTKYIPGRFDRFARRVLGDQYGDPSKDALRVEFNAFIEKGLAENKLVKAHNIYPNKPGFGRVDALNRISNQVFGFQLAADNLRPADAPVAYPHIWETSWFNYVQYNGSVPNPLLRNIGEALGVKAPIVLTDPAKRFKTAVHVDNLREMERWLAGTAPYQGLHSPKWSEQYLGKIDRSLAAQGERLYGRYCASCHLPAQPQLIEDLKSTEPKFWTVKTDIGQRLLDVPMIEIDRVGTDPQQARGFATRKANTGPLGWGDTLAGVALDAVTRETALRFFRDNKIPESEWLNWSSGQKVGGQEARVKQAYKARPLSGVWATPPYLHNGSVPTLHDLLVPASERPRTFYLGTKRYDAKKLGYESARFKGGFEYDTRITGNSNAGHEFDDRKAPGVIGPRLSDADRGALLEYLKTL
jgi:cytochrome c5